MSHIFKSGIKSFVTAWLIAGTLDILSAIFILAHGHAEAVFRFIARGAFGESAMQGGSGMIVMGALFHYFIAFCFTSGYFLVSSKVKFLRKCPIISGLLYGIFVWGFMRYIVLPLTYNVPAPFSFSRDWLGIVILMYAIGLPASLISSAYYRNK